MRASVLVIAFLLLNPTITHAQFVRQIDPFPVFADGNRFAQPFFGGFDRPIPQLVDIDGDGDPDLFVQEDDEALRYFENVGTAQAHRFEWRTDQFADLVGEWFYFADLDADSDLDLLAGINFNEIAYVENTGSDSDPVFSSLPLIVRDSNGLVLLSDPPMVPSVVDVDCDGTLDLFIGQQAGTIKHFAQVVGSGSFPIFELVTDRFQDIEVAPAASALRGPQQKAKRHGANGQAFLDADLDGDIDLFYGDFFEKSLLYFRNDGTCSQIDMSRVSDSLAIGANKYFKTTGFNLPTPADLNGDDTIDLVVGTLNEDVSNLVNNLFFLENTAGSFSLLQTRLIDGIDVGTLSVPAFGDVDGDGDEDLVVGSSLSSFSSASLALIRRSGSDGSPIFELEDLDFLELGIGFNYSPTFADVDADDNLDLFVGMFNGQVAFLKGQATAPFFSLESESFADIDVGSNATPAFGDIDADGDLDMLVGESTGTINLVENIGNASTPNFGPVQQNYAGIDIGQYSRLQLVDWDNDSDLDVLIGGPFRGLMLAENIGSTTTMILDTLVALRLDAGFEATPTFADVDGDGDFDIVSGDVAGGLRYFQNQAFGSNLESPFRQAGDLLGTIYPNPVGGHSFTIVAGKGARLNDIVRVSMFDLLGQLVFETQIRHFSPTIRVVLPENIASGPLLVNVTQGSRVDKALIFVVR